MKKKQMVIMFILILAMAMTVTACGIEKDTDESATVGSVIDIEDIMQEIPTEDVKEETDNVETEVPTKSEDVNTQSGEEINSGTDTNEQVNQNSVEPVVEPSEEQKPTDQSAEPVVEPSEKQEPTEQPKEQSTEQPTEPSVPSETIVGSIKSLGNGSFSISKANVNGNVMVSTDEMVNVVYSNSTEFEVCTSTDGGITASFSAGTSADLQTGRLVNIQGAYEGSDFVAQKIRIEIFG